MGSLAANAAATATAGLATIGRAVKGTASKAVHGIMASGVARSAASGTDSTSHGHAGDWSTRPDLQVKVELRVVHRQQRKGPAAWAQLDGSTRGGVHSLRDGSAESLAQPQLLLSRSPSASRPERSVREQGAASGPLAAASASKQPAVPPQARQASAFADTPGHPFPPAPAPAPAGRTSVAAEASPAAGHTLHAVRFMDEIQPVPDDGAHASLPAAARVPSLPHDKALPARVQSATHGQAQGVAVQGEEEEEEYVQVLLHCRPEVKDGTSFLRRTGTFLAKPQLMLRMQKRVSLLPRTSLGQHDGILSSVGTSMHAGDNSAAFEPVTAPGLQRLALMERAVAVQIEVLELADVPAAHSANVQLVHLHLAYQLVGLRPDSALHSSSPASTSTSGESPARSNHR